jgi:hypothetical protein
MMVTSTPELVMAAKAAAAEDGHLAAPEVDLRAGDVVMLRSGSQEMVVLKVVGDVVFATWDNQSSFSSCAPFARRDLVRLQVG